MERFLRVHFTFWSKCCCCCCLLLVLPTTSVLKRCFSVISPRRSVVSSRGLRAAIALSREGLPRVRIRPRRGRCAALARWQGRVSGVSHTRLSITALFLYNDQSLVYICITPVFSSTSRLFNILSYPHVNSSADYEMPHFRRISPGQYKRNKITTLEASIDRQQSSVAIRLVRTVLRRWTHAVSR